VGQADDLRKSADAGFDHRCVKPVDHNTLTALFLQAPSSAGSME
jgi:hypothetical protein